MPANTRNKWEIWLAAILSRAYFDAMSGTLTPHYKTGAALYHFAHGSDIASDLAHLRGKSS